jgi:ATP-dependent exoDNAse (exonuclease V) beta subunit
MDIEKEFFRRYDKEITSLDLTGPIESPSYYQLSFKSIRYYRACPLKFYYSVVLGLKAEDQGAQPGNDATSDYDQDSYTPNEDRFYDSEESLIIGGAIHAYLERHRFGESLDHDLLKKIWLQYEEKLAFTDSMSKEANQKLRSIIQRHLTNVTEDKNLVQLIGSGQQYAEVPFLFPVVKGYDFRGFIDRLVSGSERGEWVILDWKSNDLTGRDPEQIAKENDYHLQLACYGWALEEILGQRAEALYLYFTDTGYLLKSRCEVHPREVINEIVNKIRVYEQDRSLAFKEMQDKTPHDLACRFCEFRGMLGCNE